MAEVKFNLADNEGNVVDGEDAASITIRIMEVVASYTAEKLEQAIPNESPVMHPLGYKGINIDIEFIAQNGEIDTLMNKLIPEYNYLIVETTEYSELFPQNAIFYIDGIEVRKEPGRVGYGRGGLDLIRDFRKEIGE